MVKRRHPDQRGYFFGLYTPQFWQKCYQLARRYQPNAFDLDQLSNPFIFQGFRLLADRLLNQLDLRLEVLKVGFQKVGHRAELRLFQAPAVVITLLNQPITLLQQFSQQRTLRADPQGGLVWNDLSVVGQYFGIDGVGLGFDSDGFCERSGSTRMTL
ncbi:hypothetical protein Q9323_01025 [Pseudomonas fulva]